MRAGYLIYHPRRTRQTFGSTTVHFDAVRGNQDPYLWNTQFLHTFCHMAQMSPEVGHICFWVSGDRWPDFSNLYCDLVFVVQAKTYWATANKIERSDPLVESDEAWQDHYRWGNQYHPYRRRRRFTLKADPEKSFQPQHSDGSLIDIVPILAPFNYRLGMLRAKMEARRGARPCPLDDTSAHGLYDWLSKHAEIKLTGRDLREIRVGNPALASHDLVDPSSYGFSKPWEQPKNTPPVQQTPPS